MSTVGKVTVTTTRHEYRVPSPAPFRELEVAIAMAHRDMPEERRGWDDACVVEGREGEIVVWWAEAQPVGRSYIDASDMWSKEQAE